MKENVVILGASDKPDRYAYKAFRMLQQYGHAPLPVHPQLKDIEGVSVFAHLNDVKIKDTTLTMYVNAGVSAGLHSEIVVLHPRRVIFNPGSENPALAKELTKNGIEVIEACTLVMLSTHSFES